MSDLIRRKALCDYISAAYYDDRFNDPVVLLDELFERAKHFPAVDAVEVVRCGDCIHMVRIGNAYYCKVWGGYNGCGIDGFCSYGERREDNDQI